MEGMKSLGARNVKYFCQGTDVGGQFPKLAAIYFFPPYMLMPLSKQEIGFISLLLFFSILLML